MLHQKCGSDGDLVRVASLMVCNGYYRPKEGPKAAFTRQDMIRRRLLELERSCPNHPLWLRRPGRRYCRIEVLGIRAPKTYLQQKMKVLMRACCRRYRKDYKWHYDGPPIFWRDDYVFCFEVQSSAPIEGLRINSHFRYVVLHVYELRVEREKRYGNGEPWPEYQTATVDVSG